MCFGFAVVLYRVRIQARREMASTGVDRRSIVQGMMQIAGGPIPCVYDESAPLCTIPFEMTDKTGLTEEMQSSLWALYALNCATQQIPMQSYLDGQGCLKCIRRSDCKTVIVRENDDVDMDIDAAECNTIPELTTELRIVQAVGRANDDHVLNVVVVVARSPKAFSISHALRGSLRATTKDDKVHGSYLLSCVCA